ncbi:MAG: hypothetical protein WBZ40_10335 [Acidimicrobiia bacterium]
MVTLAACSGATVVVETTTATITLSDLIGSWENDLILLQVAGDGSYLIFSDPQMPDVVVMTGFVARNGEQFDFVTGTQGDCPGQTGVYTGELEGEVLTFTLANDPCELRQSMFSEPFTRREQ